MPDTNFPWKKSIDVVETIKRLVKDSSYDLATPQTYGEFRSLALMAARELEAARPRWISVEERLPEKGQKVAFIPNCNPRSVYVGEISHVGRQGGVMFKNSFSRTTMKYYATHWMPLPEPPKEVDA